MTTIPDHDQPQSGLSACLQGCELIPVITLQRVEDAVPLAEALMAGGLKALEFTLRTPAGVEALKVVRSAFPEALLGAGTIRNIHDYHAAVAAGADFVVSPGSTPALLDYGITAAIPLLPGITTLSELMFGHERGYRIFKFFPAAASGGAAALKAFLGPFPDVGFVPTGGVGKEEAAEYLAVPGVRAVGGTWLAPEDLIERQDWEAIRKLVADSLAQLAP